MAHRLANGMSLRLQFLSCFVISLPRLREFRDPDLLEPGLAIGVHRTDDGPGHGVEFLSIARDRAGVGIVPSLLARNFLRDVAYINNALRIEGRLIVENHDEVGTASRLDGSCDPRLQVIAVHRLKVDFDAECLLGFRQQLLAQQLIGCRHEIIPSQPVDRGLLRIRRRPARRQDRGKATTYRRRSAARELQECPTSNTTHDVLPIFLAALSLPVPSPTYKASSTSQRHLAQRELTLPVGVSLTSGSIATVTLGAGSRVKSAYTGRPWRSCL